MSKVEVTVDKSQGLSLTYEVCRDFKMKCSAKIGHFKDPKIFSAKTPRGGIKRFLCFNK
jgi:hypothetical protein